MDYNDVIKAVEGRNWYSLAALAVLALVAGWKKFSPGLYYKIPDGYRWIPPLALAALMGFVDGYYAQLPWKQALIRAGYAVLAAGFGAAGAHGILKESPLPYGGGPGGKPLKRETAPAADSSDSAGVSAPKLSALLLMLGLLFLPSCSAVKPIINTAHDIAKLWCEAHYKASGKEQITAEELCASEKILRPWIDMVLAGEKDGVEAAGKTGAPTCEPAVEKPAPAVEKKP